MFYESNINIKVIYRSNSKFKSIVKTYVSEVLCIYFENKKKIMKLSENLFLFIYLIEGDEIKENDFSYQVSNKYIFSILSGPKTNDKIKPTLPGLSATKSNEVGRAEVVILTLT